jgi:hypothetical protein
MKTNALVLCLVACGFVLASVPAEAGSIVIPAWSFTRGNARIDADPARHADAGPVVVPGEPKPWGWTVEYDVDIPVDGSYTIQVCYATGEARPVHVFVDSRYVDKCGPRVTLDPKSSGQPDTFTWKSSGAIWRGVRNQWGRLVGVKLTKGVHVLKIMRRGPLPHLVALRMDTGAAFPEGWKPPQYKVRDLNSIQAAHRKTFLQQNGSAATLLRQEIERMVRCFGPHYPKGPEHLKQLAALGKTPADAALAALRRDVAAFWKTQPKVPGGWQEFPAYAFDRGNVRIYASPDKYADAGPLIGNDPQEKKGVVEYDLDVPSDGEYALQVKYAAAEVRPVEVFIDDESMGKTCLEVTYGSAPFEIPVRFSWDSSSAIKKWEGLNRWGRLRKMKITKGKHTLRLTRNGPLPNLIRLRLSPGCGGPGDRVKHLDRVPPKDRSVFLPAGSVNVAALRLSLEDMTASLGAEYPNGPQYLKRLVDLEKKQQAAASAPAGEKPKTKPAKGKPPVKSAAQKVEDALQALQREALLAHPALKFDKLLFVKRTPFAFNTYQDSKADTPGGSLCVLSPVAPDGKVTSLVPELDGGLFSRFDLSFDAKRMAFGYKKKGKTFRIYEIEIDPAAGTMVPGTLRQLTFGGKREDHAVKNYGANGYDDMDPCYMPNGQIMFTSTRSQRRVFCNPSIVTTLHLMDADGKNMHCLSGSPLNEVDPCLLDDGRIIYTRWEYVDKGLGNGQSLWAVRQDGSGSEHVYKNSILRPAQLLNARSIPGSRKLVTVGSPHCGGRLGGPVILVDYRITRRDYEAMTCITPEIGYPCMHQARYDRGFFREPHPFSEKFFLISHRPAAKGKGYGIYALDGWGNRALLVDDPKISCFQPTPLQPRPTPTNIAPVIMGDEKREKTATMFVQDVYQGMTGIERGRVKYLRVMGPLPWQWEAPGVFRAGMAGNVHRKRVYGVAKVREDGSASFTVPAGENIFFQALDENYMQLQHMPTFINMMPGEKRACIGCHEHRSRVPVMKRVRPLAMNYPVQPLAPQPGDKGPRNVHYATDVQPILDKRCVSCHGGKNPKGHLDLTGKLTNNWCRSYENLIGKGLVSVRDCRYGRSGFRPEKPLSFGSHLSKLVERLRADPCKGKLTLEEFIKIITWIDANSPYIGHYGGHGGSKS